MHLKSANIKNTKKEHQPLFLLIYLYYEVKGKSTNFGKVRLNLLHKIILGLAPDGAKGKNGRSRLHPLPNK